MRRCQHPCKHKTKVEPVWNWLKPRIQFNLDSFLFYRHCVAYASAKIVGAGFSLVRNKFNRPGERGAVESWEGEFGTSDVTLCVSGFEQMCVRVCVCVYECAWQLGSLGTCMAFCNRGLNRQASSFKLDKPPSFCVGWPTYVLELWPRVWFCSIGWFKLGLSLCPVTLCVLVSTVHTPHGKGYASLGPGIYAVGLVTWAVVWSNFNNCTLTLAGSNSQLWHANLFPQRWAIVTPLLLESDEQR